MNIYVGNLSYDLTEQDVQAKFEEFGSVKSVKFIMDKDNGKFKGFGFVEMENDNAAKDAIDSLNGTELNGRAMKVNEARPRN